MEETHRKAQKTYNIAADSFDHPANSYWNRYGEKTIKRLALSQGNRVLDVACGTGASAIPAGEMVGPDGKVIGIDLSEEMLNLARKKALSKGLDHVDFRYGNMVDLEYSKEFDAVVCVFGVFFVADMEKLLSGLWKFLKPGGKLAITTWGANLFEPLYKTFDDTVKQIRPDLVSEFRPWDKLIQPDLVHNLLKTTGSNEISSIYEAGTQPIESSEDWWKVVEGSGLRGVVEALGPEKAMEVKRDCAKFIQENRIQNIETNVIYGTAIKQI